MWRSAEELLLDPDVATVLLRLAELSESLSAEEWLSRFTIGDGLGLSEEDVLDHLGALTAAGFAKHSERMASGWRISSAGRRSAQQLRTSRSSGRDRYEYTMRRILHLAVEREKDFLRDHWEAWDLHAPGTPPVSMAEREAAMDALEEQGLISSSHAHGTQGSHARCGVTPKGRMMMGRPDISLADAHLAPASTSVTYDQRVGIRAESLTNQGALQFGDHSVQYVSIANDQRNTALSQLESIRHALQDPGLPNEVVGPVTQAVDALEQELGTPQPDKSRMSHWREQALAASAQAMGTESGKGIMHALVGLGQALA